jgi:hypothetical protein
MWRFPGISVLSKAMHFLMESNGKAAHNSMVQMAISKRQDV